MNKSSDVLERTVLHPGKFFLKAGEENMRAYIVQAGEVASVHHTEDGNAITVEKFGPGTIIGERGLLLDDVPTLSYEATQSTTVIVITRQDFEKQMKKVPKVVRTVLDHALKKIQGYETKDSELTINQFDVDELAVLLVSNLVKGLSDDKKAIYQETITPHINGLIKAIKELKGS